jgi:hypothetical protein
MEDFPSTMKAIEAVVPRFFMGSSVLYEKANEALHEKSKTAHRKEPDEKTLETLRKGLSREYELYNFIKTILYQKIDFFKANNLWD